MGLDVSAVVSDVIISMRNYEAAMDKGMYREADRIADRAKMLVNELHNEAWHSFHTSGTGAI